MKAQMNVHGCLDLGLTTAYLIELHILSLWKKHGPQIALILSNCRFGIILCFTR